MRSVEQLTTLADLKLGTELHRSFENVCLHGTFRDERVVVKRVILSRPESLPKFEEEVAVLSKPELANALVVPRAVVRAAPHYSIVLPFMELGSTNNLIARCVLPLELMLCIALDSARALATLHSLGYVHRDIKSANVLVDADWRAWITDLGSAEQIVDENGNAIVRALDTAALSQPSGGFFKRNLDGTTLGYSAPEILRNKPAVLASDIYGLGMTFAELLTGEPPYQGIEKEDADMHTVMDASYSDHALIVAITTQSLRPGLVTVSEKPGMPIELIDLIRQMWHDEPAERPSATEVVSRLEQIIAKLGFDPTMRAELAKSVVDKADQEAAGMKSSVAAPIAPKETSDEGYQVHDVPTISIDMDFMEAEREADNTGARPVGEPVKFNTKVPVGAFATSGCRGADKMEDRHAIKHFSLGQGNGELSVVTIFDGHGGAACAQFANNQLATAIGTALAQNPMADEAERAARVKAAFVQTDKAFREGPSADKSGCTAMAVVIWNPDNANAPDRLRVLVANAGDCRAVLARQNLPVRLSNDHTASCPSEQERIRAAGGTISTTRDGKQRVQGHIQVTRAIGDAAMKPYGVTAEPEVQEFDIDTLNGDDFLVMATDGVWDTVTDSDAVKFVNSTAKECGLSAKRIGGEALMRGSTDNITCVVCFLKTFNQHMDVSYA